MRLSYVRKDGSELKTYYWGYNQLEIEEHESSFESHLNPRVEVDFYNPDSTFVYDGDTFRFWDYQSLTVKELVDKVDSGIKELGSSNNYRVWISDDIALQTILKYHKHLGFVIETEIPSKIPSIGLSFITSYSHKYTSLFVPFDGRYTRDGWHYKISLRPYSDEVLETVGTKDIYFSDFWSMVCQGIYKMVDLDSFI